MNAGTVIKRFMVLSPGFVALMVGNAIDAKLIIICGVAYLFLGSFLLKKFASKKDLVHEQSVKEGLAGVVSFASDPKKNILDPLEKKVAHKISDMIEKHKDDDRNAS